MPAGQGGGIAVVKGLIRGGGGRLDAWEGISFVPLADLRP